MRSGQKIPLSIEPDESLQVPSHRQLKMILQFCNALLSAKVVRSSNNRLTIADENAILEIGTEDGGGGAEGNFPFEILQPNTGTADFLKIQVNEGNLFSIPGNEVASRDMGVSHISEDVDNFNTTITLPSSGAIFVWIGFTALGGWAVYASDTDDATWRQFGVTDNYHFVIAFIDSVTDAGSQQLIVSQYVNEDYVWPIQGGVFQNVGYYNVVVYEGNYNGAHAYVDGSSVVTGVVADGFPADGTYIYLIGGGVGPGGDWRAF